MGIQKICHWKPLDSSCHSHISNCKGKRVYDQDPVFAADSADDSDGCDLTEACTELGMVEGQICSIPYELYDLPDLKGILSLDTWNSCLTEEERFSLSAYLPDVDEQTFWLTMKELLGGSNMYFGNPLDTFFKRLKGGFYPPTVACLRKSVQFLQMRKYYHSLRSYHDKMSQMFINMRRVWDQCDTTVAVDERLKIWRTRRKRKDLNLLDLNTVPKDAYMLSEEVNPDGIMSHLSKRMKSIESVRANTILPSPFVNGMNLHAPGSNTKGVLKVKASGNGFLHSQNQKIVQGDMVERFRLPVPKGLLKVVPKVPPSQSEQSRVLSRRPHPALLAGAQGLQDCKLFPSAASSYLWNAGAVSGFPVLWQKTSSSKDHTTPEQPQCVLNRQDGTLRGSRYSHVSDKNIDMEVSIADLSKCKLSGHNMGRGPTGEYESLIDIIGGGKKHNFRGRNLWQNLEMGNKGFSERSLESYPFSTQCHDGERQTKVMQKENMSMHPRIPEGFSRFSDIGSGSQERLLPSSNQMKSPNDVSVDKTEKVLIKPSLSEGFKDERMLPLTYKRRKSQAKLNSSDLGKSAISGTDLRSDSLKEANQNMGESVKALKIKFMGWEDTPLNKQP